MVERECHAIVYFRMGCLHTAFSSGDFSRQLLEIQRRRLSREAGGDNCVVHAWLLGSALSSQVVRPTQRSVVDEGQR